MERKERILSYLQSNEYIPLKFDELKAVLDVPSEAEEEFKAVMDGLCAEGSVYITKKGRYLATEKDALAFKGTVRCNARGYFAFVVCSDEDGQDIFVPGDMLGGALDGDEVLVKADGKTEGAHRTGRVIKILSRANKTVTGIVRIKNGSLTLYPDNRRLYAHINLEDDTEIQDGERAAAEITEYVADGKIYGRIIAVLGAEDDLKGLIDGAVISSGISFEFGETVTAEAEKCTLNPKDFEGRLDLRDKLIFTIDGDDARDFDDAVSLEKAENGNYILGVHIADVSHYVKPGNALDCEAYLRGTSVYLADRVIPMLPEALSNGICSLKPNEDRLTLSVIMEIDRNGGVVNHRIEKTVICSKERMTYTNATKLLTGGDAELNERYSHIIPTLCDMQKLAEILFEKRKKRGAILFDFPETAIKVDENGRPIDITKAERGISNGIIEEFMLCANETVAEFAYWAELPFIYRVHEQPSKDKITAFNGFIKNFGLTLKGGKDGDIHPKSLQSILDAVKDTPEERMVAHNMLHSLMKAEYKTENLGHFGLSAKYYCHFTSPIRRYPDLAIHRILKDFISGKETEYGNLYETASHSSECEVKAEHIERDVEEMMKTAYMSDYIGGVFDGIVSGTANFGMFVELDNSVEGMIRLESIKGDYYEYDEISGTLTGKRTGRTYRIGDGVRVAVAAADIQSGKIDFVLECDMDSRTFDKRRRTVSKIRRQNSGRKKFVRKKRR